MNNIKRFHQTPINRFRKASSYYIADNNSELIDFNHKIAMEFQLSMKYAKAFA